MKIKLIQEKANGTYEFTAELNDAQHKFLLEFAIQELLRRGLAVPLMNGEDEVVTIVDMNTDEDLSNPRHSN